MILFSRRELISLGRRPGCGWHPTWGHHPGCRSEFERGSG